VENYVIKTKDGRIHNVKALLLKKSRSVLHPVKKIISKEAMEYKFFRILGEDPPPKDKTFQDQNLKEINLKVFP
jgi:hypothetical protein